MTTSFDILSPKERSKRMSLIKSANTTPELIVRRLVYAMGYRYRLHAKNLPGKPDMTFTPLKKVIFIHGCFWHRHSAAKCKLARMPKSKLDYWKPKLERNKKRDASNQRKLRKLGWSILTIWQCELKNVGAAETRIRKFLKK